MNFELAVEQPGVRSDSSSDNSWNLLEFQADSVPKPALNDNLNLLLGPLSIESLSEVSGSRNKDSCDAFPATKTQKESLEATIKGESALNRIYEVAVLTPAGAVKAADFEKVYGEVIAAKIRKMGATEIERRGDTIKLILSSPLHYGDETGSIDIATRVSFTSRTEGGMLAIEDIRGVTARSGFFQVNVRSAELQPRDRGYLSGVIQAGPSEAKVCAAPDGSIYH